MNRCLLSVALPLVLVAITTLPGVTALAADPPAAPAVPTATTAAPAVTLQIDDAAMALLKKSQDRMLGLNTYRAEALTVTHYSPTLDGKPDMPSYTLKTVTSEKPNRMRYEYCPVTVAGPSAYIRDGATPSTLTVSDGKTVWQTFDKNYTVRPFTSLDQLSNGAPWQGFYLEKTSPYTRVLSAKEQGELLELRGMGSETVGGVVCWKVLFHWKPSDDKGADFKMVWFVGPDDLVYRTVETLLSGDHTLLSDTTVHNIKVNAPVPDGAALFTYVPPAGMKLYVPEP